MNRPYFFDMFDLTGHPLLAKLAELSGNFPGTGQFCLVGGAIRDSLSGHVPVDFDFTTEHDPTPLARAFAGASSGHWFWLDERRRQSRVVVAGETFDFAPWRALTLVGDLAARDFTINALVIDMAGSLTMADVTDPLGGRQDLATGVLRCAGPGVLEDDPLRLLKGIRHAAELGLTVDAETLDAMRSCAGRLSVIAPERLRLEIWRILDAPGCGCAIDLLAECGAGEKLFNHDFSTQFHFVREVLTCAQAFLDALGSECSAAADWLCEPIEQGLERRTLLLWCRALGAIDAELPLRLAESWRFSRLAQTRIAALRQPVPQLWPELFSLPCRPRPVALWAQQYGPDPVDLLLALGLSWSEGAEDVCRRLKPYLEAVAELDDPRGVAPLVDGRWLMDHLGVTGPEIGAVHARLRRAEIAGIVSSPEEARRFLLECSRKNS